MHCKLLCCGIFRILIVSSRSEISRLMHSIPIYGTCPAYAKPAHYSKYLAPVLSFSVEITYQGKICRRLN